jgi:hypothetical protein
MSDISVLFQARGSARAHDGGEDGRGGTCWRICLGLERLS